MRSDDEILARIEDPTVKKRDRHGIERSRLLEALPFDKAQRYLQGRVASDWYQCADPGELTIAAKNFLEYAWSRANSKQMGKLIRLFAHFRGILWLLGETMEGLEEAEFEQLDYYGKPLLVQISERFNFNWRDADDGQWFDTDPDSTEHSEPTTAEAVLGDA